MTKKMSDLSPGEKGVVQQVGGQGNIRRRCIDMGIVPGTEIELKKFAPLGDPIEIRVRGFSLALRKNEAQWITVNLA